MESYVFRWITVTTDNNMGLLKYLLDSCFKNLGKSGLIKNLGSLCIDGIAMQICSYKAGAIFFSFGDVGWNMRYNEWEKFTDIYLKVWLIKFLILWRRYSRFGDWLKFGLS